MIFPISLLTVVLCKTKNLIMEEWNIGTFDVVIDFGFIVNKDQKIRE